MNLGTSLVRICALALLLGLLSASTLALGSNGPAPPSPAGIDSELLDTLSAGGTADLVVVMTEQADLSAALAIDDWSTRGHLVYETLRQVAARTQAPVVAYAEAHGLPYQSTLANNAVYIEGGDLAAAQGLAQLPGVALIRAPYVAQLQPAAVQGPAGPEDYGWNLDVLDPATGLYGMQAAQVWNTYGITGTGIIVANIDTGVYYQHVSLDRQYRGNLSGEIGGPYDHDYNWYQPNFRPCGNGTYPCDSDSHGTGTAGIMVAETPDLVHQPGVAPGARWIACQGCDDPPYCTEAALTGCADWMLAPCPIGSDPGDPDCDPDLRPHIVNNSWGGGGCNTWYEPYVEAWVAAGIFPAFAAGNAGGCGTVASPGDLPPSFGVAAHFTDGNNAYSGGPSCFYPTPTCDPDAHDIDPHVNAPTGGLAPTGQQGEYFPLGGTSGATPHVAGTVALLWSANPGLIGQIDATFTILEQSANRDLPAPTCGKPACAGAADYPNYDLGWGYLDALAAVEMAGAGAIGELQGTVTEAAPLTAPGDPLPDVAITAQRLGSAYLLHAGTDLTGMYGLTLPAGTYTVTADGPQHGPATATSVLVVTDTVTTLDFELLPKGLLVGTVNDAETGAPLAAHVSAPGANAGVDTDPDTGAYELYLGQGTHDVVAQADNYADETATVTIVSGEQTAQDFSLFPALALAPWPIEATVELGGAIDVTTIITNRTAGPYTFTLSHAAGRAGDEGPILLVDDETLEENPVAFEIALANLDYDYVRIEASEFLSTTIPELLDYGALIYAGTAGAAEQDHLVAYLDAGGRLLLSDSSFTLYHQDTSLHRVYLQAIFDGAEEWAGPQIGLDIMDGLSPDISSMVVVYDSFAGPEGVGIFQAPGSHYSGIRTARAGYRAIYLSFDLNRIGAREPGDADETAVVRPALLWLLGYPVTAPWFGTDVSSGIIPAGGALSIQSQFDASSAAGIEQPGAWYAWLTVEPEAVGEVYPRLQTPAVMTVVPRPTMGQVVGTVTTDRPGGPKEAELLLEADGGGSWTLRSDWWTGGYGYWLEAGDYTLTVSADGYYTETAQVTISAGTTLTHDVLLTLAAPEITLAPQSLEDTILFGTVATHTLQIGNAGPEPLTFEVLERDRGATPLPLSLESVAPQGVDGAQILFDAFHGSNPTYYGELFADLQSLGATIEIWSSGYITATALSDVDILFLGDFADVPYRFDELDAIDDFVRAGGGLFASYECCDDATVPAVTELFDITYPGRGGTSGVTYDIYPHPTTEGVGAVDLPSRQYLMTPTITGTAEVVVYDLGGEPAAAVNVVGNGKVFVIADQSFWDSVYGSADNTQLARNTFGWLYGDVPWLAADPVSATVAPGEALTVAVTLDGGAVGQPAIYHGDLVLPNNDPLAPSLIVPITVTVEPTADLGRLLGTVTGDRPGGPLAAQLLIEGDGAPLTLHTHPGTGEYDHWMPSGSYDVTASAAGYLTATDSVVVPAGGNAVLDFDLVLDAPGVAALPPAVEQTVGWGMTATQRISVTNVGVRDLDFVISEEDISGTIAQEAPAYAFDYENDEFVTFVLDDPNSWTVIASYTYEYFDGGDFRLNDFSKLYTLRGSYLYTLDTATGETTYIGTIGQPYPHFWMGLTIDGDGTLYGVTDYWYGFGEHESYLWTIDPDHGIPTQIGQITNAQLVAGIAVNLAGEMYGVDVEQDVLLQIDPATGAGTVVGPLGFDAWNVALDFDDDTGVLYMADYQYLSEQGHLWTMDVATGIPTQLWDLPPGVGFAFLAIAADGRLGIPWLTASPTGGTVPPGGTAPIDLTFDASDVSGPGAYRGNLHVESNDPLVPDLPVPVTMTVTAGPNLGQIEGTVQGTGYCDAETTPLAAQVTIESTEGLTWTQTSDAGTGAYVQWVPTGTYTVTAEADEHVGALATVEVVAGETTVQDFDLRLSQPCLVVTPRTYSLTLSAGSRLTETLTIGNEGAQELIWALRETTDTRKTVSIPRLRGEPPRDAAPTSILPLTPTAPATPPAGGVDAGVLIGEPAYGLDTSTFNLVYIPNTQEPGTWDVLSNVGDFYSGGDFWHGDFTQLYALDFFTSEFVTLDLATGDRTVIGTAHALPGHHWTGLTAANDGTIYGVSTECNVASALYTIDRSTGEAALVGTTSSAPCLIDVAINAQGAMYAVDISSDALFQINPATGAATAIGLLGVDANHAQSMDFEEETGVLYWAATTNVAGELRYIDTTTGHSLHIGYFPNYTGVDCFAMATGGGEPFWGDVPWVTEVPTSGVTLADSAIDVDVVFDTADLAEGDCVSARLGILHDDPRATYPAMITMTLCVTSPWPVFVLNKTADVSNVSPGDPATYTLVFGNDGSLETGITISDALPAEVVYGWSEPAGIYDPLSHELVWPNLVLDEGSRLTATVGVTVSAELAPGSWITNTAYLLWRDEVLSDWVRIEVGRTLYLPLAVKSGPG